MQIHHVNILVRDLQSAIDRFSTILGQRPEAVAPLPGRGVRTARFRLGQSWLILVEPTDPESPPGLHLARHGEGLFLLSLGVSSLTKAEARLGEQAFSSPRRQGLDGWQVRDLDPTLTNDAQLQLTESLPKPPHP